MTPRALRRAAERQREKLARKAERTAAACATADAGLAPSDDDNPDTALCFGDPDIHEPLPVSAAQLRANRSNAQLSTGPSTAAGKANSCLNAVKTGLTGRTVLLPSDDAAEYERHIRAFERDFNPVGPQERELVQSIADTFWRLRRIPCLEGAIFAKGHVDLADAFSQVDPSRRSAMIELETFLRYEKQLRNLQLQEARLARRREKELAELRKLQQERKASEMRALDRAATLYLAARKAKRSFVPEQNGFDFSSAQIERHLQHCSPQQIARLSAAADQMTHLNDRDTQVQAA